MLGILVIILVSWVLLHFVQKTDLNVLGYRPVLKRTHEFLLGFVVLATINFSFVIDKTWITGAFWVKNPDLSISLLLDTLWYHFKSALTEDLVFRGAILYMLIQRFGSNKAIWFAAVMFGVYHWFSFGLITSGNIVVMALVFILTGGMGYAWGFTFHKTKSIAMGLGMHLGWNMMQAFFYEGNPYGEVLFQLIPEREMGDVIGLIFTLAKGIVPPLLVVWFVKVYVENRK